MWSDTKRVMVLYVQTKRGESIKVTISRSFSRWASVSAGRKQQHDFWQHIFGGEGVKINVKSEQLYGNELQCSSVGTNQNLEVLRSKE